MGRMVSLATVLHILFCRLTTELDRKYILPDVVWNSMWYTWLGVYI